MVPWKPIIKFVITDANSDNSVFLDDAEAPEGCCADPVLFKPAPILHSLFGMSAGRSRTLEFECSP